MSIRSVAIRPPDVGARIESAVLQQRKTRTRQGGDAMKELNRRTLLTGATALAATAATQGSVAPAHAAAPASGKQAAGYYRYKVGDFEITAINDGVWLPDVAPALFKNVSVDDAKKALADQFQ